MHDTLAKIRYEELRINMLKKYHPYRIIQVVATCTFWKRTGVTKISILFKPTKLQPTLS